MVTWTGTGDNDTYHGGADSDSIRGLGGDDTLFGGLGDDQVMGDGGNDRLFGEDGDDVLNGWSGADYLSGGAGRDWADYSEDDQPLTVNLSDPSQNTGVAAGDTYNSIENLSGGWYDDVLTGNNGRNDIRSGAGNDAVRGLAGIDALYGDEGNDTLNGGLGADYLSGGAGSDRASYIDATSGLRVSLATASQNTGEAAGDTYKSIENLTGSNYGDSLTGSNGANRISGADGNDTINGLAGSDVIFAGSGNDRIYGHLGSDTLEGNAGSDTFIFHTALGASNIDTIADFSRADDTIELWNDIFTVLGSGPLAASAFKDMAVSAKDANDRIIYNSDTGILYYDADGSGTAFGNFKFAVLSGKPDITASDFVVV